MNKVVFSLCVVGFLGMSEAVFAQTQNRRGGRDPHRDENPTQIASNPSPNIKNYVRRGRDLVELVNSEENLRELEVGKKYPQATEQGVLTGYDVVVLDNGDILLVAQKNQGNNQQSAQGPENASDSREKNECRGRRRD